MVYDANEQISKRSICENEQKCMPDSLSVVLGCYKYSTHRASGRKKTYILGASV